MYVHSVPMQGTLFSSLFSGAFRQCLHLSHTQTASPMPCTDFKKKSFFPFCNIQVHGDFPPHCTGSSRSTGFSQWELGHSCKKQTHKREGQKSKRVDIDTLPLLYAATKPAPAGKGQQKLYAFISTHKPLRHRWGICFSEIHKDFCNLFSRWHCPKQGKGQKQSQELYAF